MSLLFNVLPRLVITFLPRSKHLLISWLQSPSTVILEPRKIKSHTVSIVSTVSIISPSIYHEVMGADAMIVWMLRFKPLFSLSSFTFIKRLFSSSLLSAIWVVSSVCLKLLILLEILILSCASSSPAFPIWNQSVVPCLVLTVASWLVYRFLRRQVRWSGIPISWIFHSLLWPTQSKALA